jgi:hypothetical protein
MIKLRGYLAAAAIAVAMMTGQSASAGTTTCTGTTPATNDVVFSLTTSGANATCLQTGSGLLDEGAAPGTLRTFAGVQYTLLDNDRDQGYYQSENDPPLTLFGGTLFPLTTDSFGILAPGFASFVVLLQGSTGSFLGNALPDWAAFLLPAGITSGSYSAGLYDITDVRLYGIAVPGPIAGAGLPALMALGGFVWARRRKADATA